MKATNVSSVLKPVGHFISTHLENSAGDDRLQSIEECLEAMYITGPKSSIRESRNKYTRAKLKPESSVLGLVCSSVAQIRTKTNGANPTAHRQIEQQQ